MNKNISVGVLGGGQLGMMLCQASRNINIKTHIYCPDRDSPAQLYSDDFTCMDYLNEKEIIKFSIAELLRRTHRTQVWTMGLGTE